MFVIVCSCCCVAKLLYCVAATPVVLLLSCQLCQVCKSFGHVSITNRVNFFLWSMSVFLSKKGLTKFIQKVINNNDTIQLQYENINEQVPTTAARERRPGGEKPIQGSAPLAADVAGPIRLRWPQDFNLEVWRTMASCRREISLFCLACFLVSSSGC